MTLVLWSFESGGRELYALSTGRTPPAEDHLLKDWKRLAASTNATEDSVSRITYELARDILANRAGPDCLHRFPGTISGALPG